MRLENMLTGIFQWLKVEEDEKMKFFNSKLLKLSAIYGIILLGLLLLTAIAGLVLRDNIFNEKQYTSIEDKQVFSILEVKNIETKFYSANAIIETTDTDEIEVVVSGQTTNDIVMRHQGKNLEIKQRSKIFNFGFPSESLNVTIKLPKNYNGDLELNNTSGNMHISDINIDNIEMKIVSGSIYISDVISKEAEFKVISGKIAVSNLQSDDISVNLASGYVDFENIQTNNFEIDQVSGSSFASFIYAPENIEVKSVSGNCKLDLPDDAEINLEKEIISGKINNALDESSKSPHNVSFTAVSGSLIIE